MRKRKKHFGYAVAGTLFLVAILIYSLTRPDSIGPDMTLLWYYDLNTKQEYTIEWEDAGPEQFHAHIPPQPAESGALKDNSTPPLKAGDPAGVSVFKFACGDCSQEQFIGFLETYPVVIREQIIAGKATPEQLVFAHFWKRVDDTEWVLKDSPAGRELQQELVKRCPGQRVAECNPRD